MLSEVEPVALNPDQSTRLGAPAGGATGAQLELVLRLQLDADGRPEGTVEVPNSSPIAFTGWLALMAELWALVSKEAR